MLNVRNGVTVSRSMLAMIADELDAERAAHAETKRERDDLKDEWQAEFESRVEANTALRMTKARLAEALKALEPFAKAADGYSQTPLYTRPSEQAVTEALRDLLDHVDRNTCAHEDTYRGGSIWTICDGCGQKWADDRGGFSPYSDPEPVAKARAALKAAMEAGRHD